MALHARSCDACGWRRPGAVMVRRPHERIVWADGPLARAARSPLLTIAGLAHEGTFGTPEVI